MIYIGIDPGLAGAVAIVDIKEILVYDMPLTKEKKFDVMGVHRILNYYTDKRIDCLCVVEASKPATGGSGYGAGISTFLINYGKVVAVLEILNILFKEVHPLTWKTKYGLIKQPKLSSIRLAKKLFPNIQYRTERGRWLDGRAEALLLADYGRRYING